MSFIRPTTRKLYANLKPKHLRCLSIATEAPGNGNHHHATNNYVKVVEVGPRDGLQNEKKIIPITTKIELISRLAHTGLTAIEAGSFVSPKWVPQMADSTEILDYLLKYPPSSLNPMEYSFLAPNTKGLTTLLGVLKAYPSSFQTFSAPKPYPSPYEPDEAYNPSSNRSTPSPSSEESGPTPFIELSIFAAATESFSTKNLNCSVAESLTRFRPVIEGAKDAGLRVRAYISVVLGCPFEGPNTNPHKVAEIACDLLEMGADEIDLGDTTGMGTAPRTSELLKCMASAGVRTEDLTLHFHDTYGQALVNTAVSLEHGVRRFDASVGGLGGCPYSPGATGNVSTEDLVYFLESLGMTTGVDLEELSEIGEWICGEIEKANSSSVGKALLGKRRRNL